MGFVEGIMENKEWVWDNGIIKEEKLKNIKSILQAKRLKIKLEQMYSRFLKNCNIINI